MVDQRSSEQTNLVLVLPVRNEAAVLETSVRSVVDTLRSLSVSWKVVIASNNSTDTTNDIAKRLSEEIPGVVLRVSSEPGKGRAIREAWQASAAEVYAFSDIDLSVDLSRALPAMIGAIRSGADLAVGSRALSLSHVDRPWFRQFISKGYRLVARFLTGTGLSDLPCGCKVVSARVVRELVPKVNDQSWFFDSELLLRAEKSGLEIQEVPVRWVERRYAERQQTIPLVRVSLDYLRALLNVRKFL